MNDRISITNGGKTELIFKLKGGTGHAIRHFGKYQSMEAQV